MQENSRQVAGMTACARGTVLQLSSMVPPTRFGGAERVVGAFGNDLERAGFRVYNRGLRSRHGGQAGCPIPNVYWPFDGRERSAALRSVWHAVDSLTLSGRMAVNRLVEELNPDVLITHNLRGWGLAPWVVCRNRGIPLVHVVHDYGLLCNSSTLWRDNANCERICGACRPRATAAVRRWPGGTLVGVSRAVLDEHRRLGFNGSGSSAVVHPDSAAAYPDRIVSLRSSDTSAASVPRRASGCSWQPFWVAGSDLSAGARGSIRNCWS